MRPNLSVEKIAGALAVLGTSVLIGCGGGDKPAESPAVNANEVAPTGDKAAGGEGHCGAEHGDHKPGEASCGAGAKDGGAASCGAGKGGSASCGAGKGGSASCGAKPSGDTAAAEAKPAEATATPATTAKAADTKAAPAKAPAAKKAGAASCGAGTCAAKK